MSRYVFIVRQIRRRCFHLGYFIDKAVQRMTPGKWVEYDGEWGNADYVQVHLITRYIRPFYGKDAANIKNRSHQ
jgi:hypothetical protein